MKVLFVSNDPSIFDPESPARVRMRSYAKAFGELHILSRSPVDTEVVMDGPLTLHPLPGGKVSALVSLPGKARRVIREYGIDVVSAQDPFEHGYAALLAVRGTRAKLHIQIHTDLLSPWFARGSVLNRVRQVIAGRVLPQADGIRVVGARIKEGLLKRYGAKIPEPSVIPIVASGEMPAPTELPPHDFSFALITVARLEREKRIGDILEALAMVKDDTVGLIIVGSGGERTRLEQLTKTLGLRRRVVFAGWQNGAWGMMQSAQAYIQASGYEGYGRTLMEAALAGMPIITTDVGIVGDILSQKDVLVAPPGDIGALAAHIGALRADRSLQEALGRRAQEAARRQVAVAGDLAEMICADLTRLLPGAFRV